MAKEKPKVPGGAQIPFTVTQRLMKSRSREYTLKSLFKYGYRNKEDISNLPAETLVVGSQNILTNASEIVGIRNGYTLDGPAGNQNNYGVDSAYDFLTRLGARENLRKWGPNLEVRYLNPQTNSVTWVSILSQLNPAKVCNFTNFWDATTELKMFCLFVNGSNSIYEWSGGMASFASASATGIGIITGLTATPVAAGSQYQLGDQLAVVGGTGGVAVVTGVNTAGGVTSVSLQSAGSGYSGGTLATTPLRVASIGAGCTVAATVSTGASITVSGTSTLSQLGFYDNGGNSSKFVVLINGVAYTYTGVSGQTFYGVTPDPSIAGIAVGDAVIQQPNSILGTGVATNGSGSLGSAILFDLIATLENQVWYGSFNSNNLYISETNNYQNVTYSAPARLPAEGALIVLDAPPIGFSPQASQMYITAGTDQWWISQKDQITVSTTSGGNTVATPTETLYAARLKTAFNQAAQSQSLVGRYKNSLIFVSNEQIINALGLVQNIQIDPQVTNMSDPIKYDVDAYNFAGGQVIYDNYFIYVSIPALGVVRMYNVVKQYWEAPQLMPVGRFYHTSTVVGNIIYGHSALTNESYQLFTGYNDNGNPISAVAAFPYVSSEGGAAFEKKSFNKIYTEGYISANANLMLTINYDFGAYSGTYTTLIPGQATGTIFNKVTDGSLGQNSLGSQPIGSILNLPQAPANPKFRIINTMPRVNVYEYQVVYSTDDVDFAWSILRFGPSVLAANDLPTTQTI